MLFYSLEVYVIIILYALPFIAYMSMISALVSSTLASMFLGMSGYGLIWILNLFTFFTEQKNFFSYLLASGFKDSLLQSNMGDFYMGLAVLPIYTLGYASLAYLLFNRRNL